MQRKTLLILTLLVASMATACVKLGGKPLDKRYYQITPTRQEAPATTHHDLVLMVRRMTISDLYNTRELVYREAEGRIESDFYNMFFVPPGNMLTTELRKWLRKADLFSHVIEPGSMVVPALTLEGVVNSLYGDFSTGSPAAVVEMQFFVIDESTANNTIVFSKSYSRRVEIAEATPQALVQALTQGVQTIYTELETELAQAPLK